MKEIMHSHNKVNLDFVGKFRLEIDYILIDSDAVLHILPVLIKMY